MEQNAATEAIIAIASKLKDDVAGLYQAYCQLPAILEGEHKAIKTGNIALVNQAGEEKAMLGEVIEARCAAVQDAAVELTTWRRRLLDAPHKKITGLSDCIATLVELRIELLAEHDLGSGLAGQVLQHVIDGLSRINDDFSKQYKNVKPIIEKNKYLVERLLAHHRESYLFWQEITEEAQSSYNAQGVQRAQGRNSGFKATA